MANKGELSKYHMHKDSTRGWDINVKDSRDRVEHKMHVSDQSGVGSSAEGILSSIAKAVGEVFDALKGKNS